MSQSAKQVRVVTQATPTPNQGFEPTTFFDSDGNPVDLAGLVSAVEDLADRVEALENQ